MIGLDLRRINRSVLGLVVLFLMALSLAAASLIWSSRQDSLAQKHAQAERFVSGAQAALNRSLLGVDVLLASLDELLGLSSLVAEWLDPQLASQRMRVAVDLNLNVRLAALINARGQVMASSDPDGAALTLKLPAGFVDQAMAQPIPTLVVSAPVVSFASAEQVLYFARLIRLADGTKIVAVAEVPVPQLTTILVQGLNISGIEVTLERSNGLLLASMPVQDQHLGKQLVPALGQRSDAAVALRMPARLTGKPAIVVARSTLYRDLLVVASIPLDTALADWRSHRNFVLAVVLVFALMILIAGAVAIWTLERKAQDRLAMAQAKATLDQALESMESGFLLLDANYQVLHWNRRLEALFPWLAGRMTTALSFHDVLTLSVQHLLPDVDATKRAHWVEARMTQAIGPPAPYEQTTPDGRFLQITERGTPEGGMVIVYHDVSALRQAAAEIELLAFHDSLTGLPNRRLLMDRLQQALASCARSGRRGALLFLDLDHFKTLNDTLGHEMGDLLLQQVAHRLCACVREEDTVARLGGDEFVVMLESLAERSTEAAALARQIGEKIMAQLNQPYQLAGQSYHNTSSIGASVFGAGPMVAADLLKQADIAMYQVKAHGRNALCFFDPQMQADISDRARMEADLLAALAGAQFVLHYQPQLALQGQVVGAEALLRWQHPLRGMVSPAEFIPLAEESDLIVSIGDWVLRTACQQLVAWQADARCRALHLSVNVSARQFRQPDFVEQVSSVLRESGASAHRLKLELTESLVIHDVHDTIAKMRELKALGLQFSIDDFGTGYSSLAYLTRLPLYQLKIDQSFVHNIGLQHSDGVIVQTIIGMSRNLGLEVIAEGVETLAQQQFLALHGCTLYQGYLFGRPTPLADFEALLLKS